MREEEQHPQVRTFELGLEFIRKNHKEDRWFLQLETFDPHEPFFTYRKYKDLYPHEYDGPEFDWPEYGPVRETPDQVAHLRYQYAALVSMCDAYLGKVLDLMDELDLWKDTMLIVNTDHGFLLGEHDWWAKNVMPFYNEIAHIPLFIWDPRCGKKGERRDGLVQLIDLAPTLLEFFGVPIPKDMQGQVLRDLIAGKQERPLREAVLFGIHGGHVNCTDGRYVYMRAPVHPENRPLYEYTLMPAHMNRLFQPSELQQIELAEPFSFTKGCRTMKIKAFRDPEIEVPVDPFRFGTLLFDLKEDPRQEHPIRDREIEEKMIRHMIRLMQENDAPAEQYERLGLASHI